MREGRSEKDGEGSKETRKGGCRLKKEGEGKRGKVRRREKGEKRRMEKGDMRLEKGDADWRHRMLTEEGERWEKKGEGRQETREW